MEAARVQDQLTEQLMQRLDESKFLQYPLMSRIEGRLRTKEQLANYTAVLVHKLEARNFQDEWLIDRIDRVVDLQRRLERYQWRSTAPAAPSHPHLRTGRGRESRAAVRPVCGKRPTQLGGSNRGVPALAVLFDAWEAIL